MKERMRGVPRDDIARAASHFGIPESEVTDLHLSNLPERGYGLETGSAAGATGSSTIPWWGWVAGAVAAGFWGLLLYLVIKEK